MIGALKNAYFKSQIQLLRVFSPATLFDRLNQLDWYRASLQTWGAPLCKSTEQQILEVGCATGDLSAYLSEKGQAVTGIDRSAQMIKLAQSKYPTLNFQVADAQALPFSSQQFDVVISASLINLVAEPQAMINELFRVCKMGGTLSLLVPCEGFTDQQRLQLSLDLGLTGFSEAALKCWHQTAPKMSVDTLRHFLQQVGFVPIEITHPLNGMLLTITAQKPRA